MTPVPLDLSLRVHADADARPRAGELVLYWMQATFRAHDNFALAFAIEQANLLRLPVLVYHGLRHDHPWANDRLHTFVLESVVDLQADFAALGIPYTFWLDDGPAPDPAAPPHRAPSALVQLADRAALVVTDYAPTFIHPAQIAGLRRRTHTPVVAVESATVVPLRHHTRAYASARSIRPVLAAALPRFLHPVAFVAPHVRRPVEVPFEPVRPTLATIPTLVARCAIDHTVPPAPAFRGGTVAGRARLQVFLRDRLARYAAERGDPNAGATSELSPYLHFGNVSIHEVLLATAAAGPPDARAAFQDEALTWRELAHVFCDQTPAHRTSAAIPAWARAELAAHEADPRPALYTAAQLEHAQTDDPLWNAAQRAYLHDGWMHNHLRMLWGKAVLAWTPDAAAALAILQTLNDKYALDGRDANTYASILWIFGAFDRPFFRRPIYGTVRYQSTRAAGRKFDVARYIRAHPPR